MSIEEIKQALDEFDKAHEVYLRTCNEAIPKEERDAIIEKVEEKRAPLWEGPFTVIRALLPIVEAAAKLKPYDFYDAESDCCIGCAGIALSHNSTERTVEFDHQEGCEVAELFDALAALQPSSEQMDGGQ